MTMINKCGKMFAMNLYKDYVGSLHYTCNCSDFQIKQIESIGFHLFLLLDNTNFYATGHYQYHLLIPKKSICIMYFIKITKLFLCLSLPTMALF